MKINLQSDRQIIEEAFQLLIENLESAKVAQFWKICNLGNGDYTKLKEKLFTGETVDTLYEKIKANEI
jgi:hypothetical protein